MPSLLLATSNPCKTLEFAAILGPAWQLKDITAYPGLILPEETGISFEENAALKATGGSLALPGTLVLADDSGLEVDILNKQPGVRSSRHANDEENRKRLKERLRPICTNPGQIFPARFRCSLALVCDCEVLHVAHGTVEGHISIIERGRGGFGYDPMFIPQGYKESFGELPPAVKNELSHRARAMDSMKTWLDSYLFASLSGPLGGFKKTGFKQIRHQDRA